MLLQNVLQNKTYILHIHIFRAESALQEQSLITFTSDSPIVQTESGPSATSRPGAASASARFGPVQPGPSPSRSPRPDQTRTASKRDQVLRLNLWSLSEEQSPGSTVRLITFTRSEVIRKMSTVAAVCHDDYTISFFIFIRNY